MKGKIMIRVLLQKNVKVWRAPEDKKYPFEHQRTRLPVNSGQGGYYFSFVYSIKSGEPFALRDDIEVSEIRGVSHQETTNDPLVHALGCGSFTHEYGLVKISKSSTLPGLEIKVTATTIENFNALVRVIRGGHLTPVGYEETVFQEMIQKVPDLQKQLDDATKRQESLRYKIMFHPIRFVCGLFSPQL